RVVSDARSWFPWVIHVTANVVRPPIADLASAARAVSNGIAMARLPDQPATRTRGFIVRTRARSRRWHPRGLPRAVADRPLVWHPRGSARTPRGPCSPSLRAGDRPRTAGLPAHARRRARAGRI